jgi:gliding motility-associated-like protein
VITLVNPTAVVWDTVGHNNISCSGANNGSIYADASGGTNPIEYRLNAQPYGAAQTFNNLTPAIYTITAKDANGCTISTTVTIVEPPILTLTPPTKVDVLCNGANTGSISTSANGGTPGSPNAYTFTLAPGGGSNSTGSFTSLTAGTYTVTVTDGAGCTKSATINISQPPAIVFTQVNSQNVNCFGQATGSITVSSQGGAGGITYSASPLIFPGQQTTPGFFENLYANLYTITATDVNGCSLSTQVSVTQNSPLSVNSVVMIEPICNGDANGSIEITSAGGGVPPYSYALNGGNFQTSALFGNLVAAPYIITLKDALGCTRDTILNLTQPLPVSGLINTTNANCVDSKDGKVIVIGTGGRGGYKYYVTPGLFINKSGIFSGLEANTYTLRVVDTAGCEFQTTFTINPPANPLNSVMTKTDLGCYGYGNEGMATANVSGGAAPYTYMWSTDPVQTDATAKSLYFGFYTVDITDVNGCVIRDSVYIEEGPCCDFSFIPNAFSPNGDRNNDEFRVLTSAGVILEQLEIRDRWGKRIWSTSDYRRGWDGKIDGQDADVATYYYILRYKCTRDGKTYIKKGDINLIR